MQPMVLLFFLVTAGALISGLTGMGGGTLILAGLLMVYPPELAIPLHSFTQLTANVLRAGIHLKSINWKIVTFYASLMLPFAWGAARIFDFINPSWLKVLVGIFILFSVMPFRFRPRGEPSNGTFILLGALSGFLGVFVGAVGPMVMPFFNRLNLSRNGMLSTKSAGQGILQISKILAFSGAAGINFMELKGPVGLLMLGSLAGVLLSIPVGRKISDDKFNKVINILMALIALKVLIEGVRELLSA
jgi:uncharacterized membrane protein YfcA